MILAFELLYSVVLAALVAGQGRRVLHAVRDGQAGWTDPPYVRESAPIKYWSFLAFEAALLILVVTYFLGAVANLVELPR